ncbi:MAG: ABC transporter ATP-binding protein/permease [Tenericutes bacterium]|jgi:putative ABC transport system permease protein|nr:ABC transporter ATP-binding protein/permease [Mycoplasmatota bacterium]
MIELKNISKFYSKNQTVSLGLRKINLKLGINEFVAIVGESGSGKTTLLNVISGIDSYEEGELYVNDEETSYFSKDDWENYRKKYIAFIFQNYNLIESYTVLQNVEAALILSGYPKDELRDRAEAIIERVGLTDHKSHKATKLSGGQKQRVVIARAIAKDAPIIVADEPTGNLDSESAQNIVELLHEISKDKLVIVVTHDFTQVKDQATRRIRIYDGEIVEDKKIEKVKPKKLPSLEDKDYQMNFKETIKMVLRNLLATPKKSILLFVIFMFITFFFAFIYGGFLYAQTEQSGYNSSFEFAPETRIVVNKKDGSAFTQAELDDIQSNSKVRTIVYNDYMLEYSNNSNRGWDLNNSDVDLWGPLILPVSYLGSDYEDMPEDEIVLSIPEYNFRSDPYDLTGDTILLYERDDITSFTINKYFDSSELVDILGGRYQSVVFVHDNLWQSFSRETGFFRIAEISFTYLNNNDKELIYTLQYEQVLVNESLADDEINISSNTFMQGSGSFDSDLKIDAFYQTFEEEGITVNFQQLDYGNMELNSRVYNEFFSLDEQYQISIFANDGIDARNYVDQLNRQNVDGEQIYTVYHPASASSGNQLEGLIFLIMNFGLIFMFGILFIGIFFISYVIIKNIINSKLSDYAIFRTIGANKSTIRSFIYLENIFVAVFAYIIFVLAIIFGTPYIKEEGFLYVLKFYNFRYTLFLFIFIMLFSALISRRYLSRVYHDSVAETLRREME